MAERQDHSEHTHSQADLPRLPQAPSPPLPRPLQGTASAWNSCASVPISWQDSLPSSSEEERSSSLKAHVQFLSLSVTQKVLGNWSVKAIRPAFIQQLLGSGNEMLSLSWEAHGLLGPRKRQIRSKHDTGRTVVTVYTEESRTCSGEEGDI